ncbi:MAG: 8-amino-7-oxononanoate synthase [Alphaproteobacteria bacterium]|nr:8-amino-7-oxononanoate synthase [Alphaproteobacteria bacterium]
MSLSAARPSLSEFAEQEAAALSARGVLRRVVSLARPSPVTVTHEGKTYLSFSSNDYLGLSRHPKVIAAATAALESGAGAGAARLVTGNHPGYSALEKALATWKGKEAALIFGSGYLANIGVIPALAGRGDVIIADRLCHASMLDGAMLSGAKLVRFRHNDLAHCAEQLEEHRGKGNCLILTESVFSMDGDKAPLAALGELADRHQAWLIVDDAHGMDTQGLEAAHLVIGTLSKALGAYGGFACGAAGVMDYLLSAARSLVFSTALPPSVIAAAHAALDVMQAEPELAARTLAHARRFTALLGLAEAQSPIVPVIMGESGAALEAMEKLKDKGFWVTAIRPPTVPEGTARLRVTFSSAHENQHIDALAEAVKEVTP